MTTDAQKRAIANLRKKQDSITLRPSKEEGVAIRAAAADSGLSVTAYLLGLFRKDVGYTPSAAPASKK